MEKARPMNEKLMKRCFFSRQSPHVFVNSLIKVLFLICTLTWCVKNHVSRQGKLMKRRNESILIIVNNYDFGTVELIFVAFHFDFCWF